MVTPAPGVALGTVTGARKSALRQKPVSRGRWVAEHRTIGIFPRRAVATREALGDQATTRRSAVAVLEAVHGLVGPESMWSARQGDRNAPPCPMTRREPWRRQFAEVAAASRSRWAAAIHATRTSQGPSPASWIDLVALDEALSRVASAAASRAWVTRAGCLCTGANRNRVRQVVGIGSGQGSSGSPNMPSTGPNPSRSVRWLLRRSNRPSAARPLPEPGGRTRGPKFGEVVDRRRETERIRGRPAEGYHRRCRGNEAPKEEIVGRTASGPLVVGTRDDESWAAH